MNTYPNLHIIVAMSEKRLIGSDGKLPWELPEDLHFFRELTLGNSVIMGRRTFESIGHPLTGRHNIVVSSNFPETAGVEIFATFEEGLHYAQTLGHDIFCIGGREIYRAALPFAVKLHISWIRGNFCGDTCFPEFDIDLWQETNKTLHEGFTRTSYLRKQ